MIFPKQDIRAASWINFDINNGNCDNKSFAVGSQDSSPYNIFFKPDGTKMYMTGSATHKIYQYSLSTPWDVSTASYDNISFNTGSQETSLMSLFFSPDGGTMYALGGTKSVFQYSLSIAWDVSTASYANKSFSIAGQDTMPYSIFFKPDGTVMYMMGANNKKINQYPLSTAWDISTASYIGKYVYVSGQSSAPRGIFFKDDGTKVYLADYTNNAVYQYSLSTAWDIATIVYDNKSLDISGQSANPRGIFFKSDGSKMYAMSYANKAVYQYNFTSQVATPTFSPAAGVYYSPQTVAIQCPTSGAVIHYTLDGTDPTSASAVFDPASPINISSVTTVKAVATKSGYLDSPIASATYTISTLGAIAINNWSSIGGSTQNKDNNQDTMYLASSGDSISFSVQTNQTTPVNYEWQVNKVVKSSSISNAFTWTVPSEGGIWEIRVRCWNENGETSMKWVISNLSLSRAPKFFDFFTDYPITFQSTDPAHLRSQKDPWGRALPVWGLYNDKIPIVNAKNGFLERTDDDENTNTLGINQQFTAPSTVKYGTWKFRYQFPSGSVLPAASFGVEFDYSNTLHYNNYYARWTDTHNHSAVAVTPDRSFSFDYDGTGWPEDGKWHEVSIVRTPDNWLYLYNDGVLVTYVFDKYLQDNPSFAPQSIRVGMVSLKLINFYKDVLATAASANTLTDSTKTWKTDEWKGDIVKIISGTGAGQSRTISSNNSNTLTISSDWDVVPDSTSHYRLTLPTPNKSRLDDFEVYDGQYMFPDKQVSYGQYVWNYRYNTTGFHPEFRNGIIVKGKNVRLSDIANLLGDSSKFSYDPVTKTAICNADLVIYDGAQLIMDGETLKFNSSFDGQWQFVPYFGADIELNNSTITTVTDKYFIWNNASSSTHYGRPGMPTRANPPENADPVGFTGGAWPLGNAGLIRFSAHNSTIDNTAHIFWDSPMELDITNTNFTNLHEQDIGDYAGVHTTGLYRDRERTFVQGDKSFWVDVDDINTNKFNLSNISFSGKTDPLNITFLVNALRDKLNVYNLNLPNDNIVIKKTLPQRAGQSHSWAPYLTASMDLGYGATGNGMDSKLGLVNCKFNSLIIPTDMAWGIPKYYLDVKVVDGGGKPVSGANVSIMNQVDDTNYPAENTQTTQPIFDPHPTGTDQYFYLSYQLIQGIKNPSQTTGSDGHTALPSDAANTLVLSDYVKDQSSQTNFTYAVSVSKGGKTASMSGLDLDPTWYRDNPQTPLKSVVCNIDGGTCQVQNSSSPIITTTRSLAVTSGTGSGSYAAGSTVFISAGPAPSGQVFDAWMGDTSYLLSPTSSSTQLTMPDKDIALAATYKTASPGSYPLTVTSGTGSGTYAQGVTVSISANTPPQSKVFDKWTGDITYLSNIYASSFTLVMPNTSISITATYKDNTGGSGSSSGGSSGSSGGGISSLLPTIISTKITKIDGNEVALSLNVNNATSMIFSDSANFSASAWENYATAKDYKKKDNQEKIYIKFKSSQGNISPILEMSIKENSGYTGSGTDSPYPDGTLLKLSASPKVYVIIQNKKKWISTPEVFQQLGYKWTSITTIPDTQLKSIPDYEDNLIRQIGDYKVYLVVNGVKHHIPNPAIFLDYGFDWNDVKDVDKTVIDKYKDTYLLKESGKDGIYYVRNDSMRKLIPTTEIFNSYSDKTEDIQIVSALEMNSYPLSNLIRLNNNPEVYLIQGNIKKYIPSVKIANKYHFNLSTVMSVNQYEFNWYKDGGVLK